MIVLPAPGTTTKATVEACVDGWENDAGTILYLAAVLELETSEASLIAAGKASTLEKVTRDTVPQGLSKRGMLYLYSSRLVPNTTRARHIYDDIRSSAPNGVCPQCGVGQVTTLDHYLPKLHYPDLAVTPANLIPSCADCNKNKSSSYPKVAKDCTIHPYFDDISKIRWLTATIALNPSPTLIYSVATNTSANQAMFARIEHHFTTFGLAKLYGANAASELQNIRHQLHGIHDVGGARLVAAELTVRAESARTVDPNSWRTNAYDAWASSASFCDGEFDL